MPFPFFPGGALLALAVLGGAMALFGLALKALDWSIDGVKGSMLSGVVSGLRDWERGSHAPTASTGSTGSGGGPTPDTPTFDVADAADTAGADLVALERVHPNEAPRHRG
jgi:hypothetical protein